MDNLKKIVGYFIAEYYSTGVMYHSLSDHPLKDIWALSVWGYYRQRGYRHSCTGPGVDVHLQFSGINE